MVVIWGFLSESGDTEDSVEFGTRLGINWGKVNSEVCLKILQILCEEFFLLKKILLSNIDNIVSTVCRWYWGEDWSNFLSINEHSQYYCWIDIDNIIVELISIILLSNWYWQYYWLCAVPLRFIYWANDKGCRMYLWLQGERIWTMVLCFRLWLRGPRGAIAPGPTFQGVPS